jgi:hypothetical protein
LVEDATASETAVSWMLRYLSLCFEDQLFSAAIKKVIASDKNKVMSVAQTVRMLRGAGLNY